MNYTFLGSDVKEFQGYMNRPCYRFSAGECEFLLSVALGRAFFSLSYATCACRLEEEYECTSKCKFLGSPTLKLDGGLDSLSAYLEENFLKNELHLGLTPLEIAILAREVVEAGLDRSRYSHSGKPHFTITNGTG